MSDMGMDPEIMNLFLGARDNNKNVSGLLNNLDSPMLAYLAGVYDPGAGQAGGGQMWSSYAGNPDYPFVQDIMQKIQNGADPFYLNSYIDAQAGKADFGGFQDADMKGLAKALYNEYTGNSSGGGDGSGGGSGTWWGKAGLRNPTDIYTTADVPLNKEVLKLASGDKDRYKKLNKERINADDAVKAAEKKLGPLYNKKFDTAELIAWLRTDPEGQKIAEEKNIDWGKVDETTGQIFNTKWSDKSNDGVATGWRAYAPMGALGNLINAGVTEVGRVGEIFINENVRGKQSKNIEDVVGYRGKQNPYEVYAYDQAKLDQAASKNAEDSVLRLDEATRKGVLRAYQEAGRTPTRDQLGTMLKFVKNT